MKKAKAIQVWGTGSGVGKSVIVSAFCRIFLQDGLRPCPFKAQNMSLNSFVTKEGGEIGRAQAVQAEAAKIQSSVDINPILLKPTTDKKAQVIVRGKPLKNMRVFEYINYKRKLFKIVKQSFFKLSKEYDVIVIEGAGSPAEINLRDHDIVNLKMAELADCPVILVGDIDKGGVFAWLVGTLELLSKKEKLRIKGFIINKFRGDKRLLNSAIDFLERKTGIKVIGVIPYFTDIKIPEEDSVTLGNRKRRTSDVLHNKISIAVIKLPHISNFTDFDALTYEEDVDLTYVESPDELNNPDVIIIPGTKNTLEDLLWLKSFGLANKILSSIVHRPSSILIGVCGGYQILGESIIDPKNIESRYSKITGLGLLSIKTVFRDTKILTQVEALDLESNYKIKGYEIHHGRSINLNSAKPIFKIIKSKGKKTNRFDGLSVLDGRVWGTYLHGIFDNDDFRRHFLNKIRLKKGLPTLKEGFKFELNKEIDKLADLVRKNIDMKLLYDLMDI